MRERCGRDLQPAGDVEQALIDEMCFNYWRLQQGREVELQIILERTTELLIIALHIRYRTGYERTFYKFRASAAKQNTGVLEGKTYTGIPFRATVNPF